NWRPGAWIELEGGEHKMCLFIELCIRCNDCLEVAIGHQLVGCPLNDLIEGRRCKFLAGREAKIAGERPVEKVIGFYSESTEKEIRPYAKRQGSPCGSRIRVSF